MKLLLTTIAAVVLVGCGESAPDISIHDAVGTGNIEAVKKYLAAGTDVNAKDKYKWTPLHNAATQGHKEVVELLIAKGADVNAKGVFEMTPLHEAAASGRKEMAEQLIAKGADVNAKNERGQTPVDYAERVNAFHSTERKKETIALLRKHGGKTGEELKAEGK